MCAVCYTPYYTMWSIVFTVYVWRGGEDWQEQVGNSSLGGKSPV